MVCVLILDRITANNYDFLKLGYVLSFQWGQNLTTFSAMPISSFILGCFSRICHVRSYFTKK